MTFAHPPAPLGWLSIALFFIQFPTVVYILAGAEFAVDPAPPVTIHEAALHSVDGRTVYIDFRGVRHRNCRLTAFTHWRSEEGVIQVKYNPNKAVLSPGDESWLELVDEVPSVIAPGRYQVQSVGEYDCQGRVFEVPTGWNWVVVE